MCKDELINNRGNGNKWEVAVRRDIKGKSYLNYPFERQLVLSFPPTPFHIIPDFVTDVSHHGPLRVQLPPALVHQFLNDGCLQSHLGVVGVVQDLAVEKNLGVDRGRWAERERIFYQCYVHGV